MADAPQARRSVSATIRKRWRAWLRALHRDIGYLLVGLTLIYAISGIAINHIEDFDPNFSHVTRTFQLQRPLPEDRFELETLVVEATGVDPDEVQATLFDPDPEAVANGEVEGPAIFEVSLADGPAKLNMSTGVLTMADKEPRFFLRIANWLHYNRGKAAWTYIADGYAVLLLYLAISGIFMLKGRKGFVGRGAVLILIGAAIPLAYVQLSSGP